MVPDAGSLRAAARTLDDGAAGLEAARTVVRSEVLGTLWDCTAGARQRTALGDLDASARTGHDELCAGATALRRLADAVDALEHAMSRAWSSTQRDLQAGLRSASGDPERADQAADLRRRLATLPGSGDASWAARVAVPGVPLPSVPASRSGGTLGPAGLPGVVRVDVGGLHALAGSLAAQGRLAAGSRSRSATAAALPLHQLDPFGLPGSRVGGLLADVTASGGAAARAADGWAGAASSARALADLVELAGEGDLGALLEDPRSATALDLSAMFRDGRSAAAVSVLEGLSPADAGWVLAHVPAGAVDDEYVGLRPPQGRAHRRERPGRRCGRRHGVQRRRHERHRGAAALAGPA